MKPLIVLVTSFLIAQLISMTFRRPLDSQKNARIAMAVMLAFTSISHFVFTLAMSNMLPLEMPAAIRIALVYTTGVIELLAAYGLLTKSLQKATSRLLIIFFIAVLPANIYAAINQVHPTELNAIGPGTDYLWFRIPLQIIFIAWTYLATKKTARTPEIHMQ